MFSRRRIILSFMASFGLVFLVLLFSLSAVSGEDDPLEYSFEKSDSEEEAKQGDDYVEYDFLGKTEYRFEVAILVENTGDEMVNFTLYPFEEGDLEPDPNTDEEMKIELGSYGTTYEIDGGGERTIYIDIDLSDKLIAYPYPYVLTLNFMNQETRASHNMSVRMNILPVYQLELLDAGRDTRRTLGPGKRLDLTLLVSNHGNTMDDIEIDVNIQGEGILPTVTKPKEGVLRNTTSRIADENAVESISVKVETSEELEGGTYYLTVIITSEHDPEVRGTVEYVIVVEENVGGDPRLYPPPPPEGKIPVWVWLVLVGILGGGGLTSGIMWRRMDEGDEEWEENDDDQENPPDLVDVRYEGNEWDGDAPPPWSFGPRTTIRSAPSSARLTCPRCRTPFRVNCQKRPLLVKCPGCFSRITLKGTKKNPTGTEPKAAPATHPSPHTTSPARVVCPRCKVRFRVKNPKRPLKVECPGCASQITLKGEHGLARIAKHQSTGTTAHIECPACKTRFKVKNPRPPVRLKCPGCDHVLRVG